MKRSSSKGFTLIELLVVISIIALLIGILLPALGAARRTARKMKGTTQVRGIVQALVTFADGNKTYFPGLDSKGRIIEDTGTLATSDTGTSGHGHTVEARYWIMLDRNHFAGDYIISPAETKAEWTTEKVESNNYSFSMLNINDDSVTVASPMPRCNMSTRAREWKATINSQSVLLSDRARRDDSISTNYDDIYSVHTSADSGIWEGSVGWGDGRAGIENEAALKTKYSNFQSIELDRLFADDQDTTGGFDIIDTTTGSPTWPTDGDSNALLGFSEAGHTLTIKNVITK